MSTALVSISEIVPESFSHFAIEPCSLAGHDPVARRILDEEFNGSDSDLRHSAGAVHARYILSWKHALLSFSKTCHTLSL